VTARGYDPDRRRQARELKAAERFSRVHGVSLKAAARELRAARPLASKVERGELTPVDLIRQLRSDPAARKSLHDSRKAVRP
jgi:hypothetical protein